MTQKLTVEFLRLITDFQFCLKEIQQSPTLFLIFDLDRQRFSKFGVRDSDLTSFAGMVEWTIVISLVAFGLLLLVAEIIFIPGTTLVGLLGFVFLAIGITLSFTYFGSTTGWVTTVLSTLASVAALYISFNSKLWKRFSLKSTNHTKVNEGLLNGLVLGQEGTAVSALRPIGKAELGTQQFEVRTHGEYLDSGTKIKIVKIELNQITVAPTT